MSVWDKRDERTTDVWLTPPYVVEALGAFDLDPCAPDPRPWDTARHYYNQSNDGLAQPWRGRVWCNPPYSGQMPKWIAKLAEHGNGIALIFARTDAAVFHDQIFNRAQALLFLRSRLRFHLRDGRPAPTTAPAPSVLVAYGRRNAQALRRCALPGKIIELNHGTR